MYIIYISINYKITCRSEATLKVKRTNGYNNTTNRLPVNHKLP